MKIYTKAGDQGKTSLVDGTSIEKSHIRLEAYGTLDELNSHLGLALSFLQPEPKLSDLIPALQNVQTWLFELGSQLACEDPKLAHQLPSISEAEIQNMESQIDLWDKELPPLKNFILPGGHPAASQIHICRTVSRRAERLTVQLSELVELPLPAVPFLNRLSDYFFTLGRLINTRLSIADNEWKP